MDTKTANLILEYLGQETVPPIEEAPILLQQLISSATDINIAVILVVCCFMAFTVVCSYINDKKARQILDRCKIEKGDWKKLKEKDLNCFNEHIELKWIFGILLLPFIVIVSFPLINLAQINRSPHRWLYEEVTRWQSFHNNRYKIVDNQIVDIYNNRE